MDTVLPPTPPFSVFSPPSLSLSCLSLWIGQPLFLLVSPGNIAPSPFSRGVTFTLSVPLHAPPLADVPSLSSPLSFCPHPAVSSYPPSQPDSSSHSVLRSLIEVIWIWWLGGWREGRLTPPPQEKNPKVPVSWGFITNRRGRRQKGPVWGRGWPASSG